MKLPRLQPLSPLARLTMALASICGAIVLLADALFGLLPSHSQQLLAQRSVQAEGVAVQVAGLLRDDQHKLLRLSLDDLRQRLPAQALLLRRADGSLLAQAGLVPVELASMANDLSTPEHIRVPLTANGQRWGRLEIIYPADARPWLLRWLAEPLVGLLLTVSVLGTTIIYLYLRRALQHLDPKSVIPERVQSAFDVMNDGVAVLDGRGRLLMANRAFRALHPQLQAMKLGQTLSDQSWLTQGLASSPQGLPWVHTLKSGEPISGLAVQVNNERGQAQALLINTMPIQDGHRKVRGCLTSISDRSPLHRANAALQQAMSELSESNNQVQIQNAELVRLATRDPLTGCLNRRAFNEAYERLFAMAQRDNSALACLVLDIDYFKKVNDTHGHSVGDRVIQELARKLGEAARNADLVCRYGGEEFVLVMPGANAALAMKTAEQLRQRIEQECGPAVREVPGMHVTASIGVAVYDHSVARPAALIDLADGALYEAKRAGRNRVALSQLPQAESAALA